jgi:Fe-Mn family superoxide dismutase
MLNRRQAMGGLAALGGSMLLPHELMAAQSGGRASSGMGAMGGAAPSEYTIPALPYAYDALEPHIDAETMRIHHDKHHAGYARGLNGALAGLEKARDTNDFSNIQHLSRALAFHAGGFFNHIVFWSNMAPPSKGGGGKPSGDLAKQINTDFGSFEKFQAHFGAATKAVEGGGWGVLGWHPILRRLVIMTMMNQQDLATLGTVPLLMCDVWEHAYYLRYQNRRADYIKAWWNVVNWNDVAERFGVHGSGMAGS